MRQAFSKSLPLGFVPHRPWPYIIAESAYGAPDSPMREWWTNRFVLPLLTTPSAVAARGRIAHIDGSAATGSHAEERGRRQWGRNAQRRETQRRSRSRSPARAPRSTEAAERAKEFCGLFNSNKGKCSGQAACDYDRKHL